MQQTVERPLSHRAIAAEVLGVSVRLTSSAELARFKNYVPSLGVKSYHQRSHDREMAMALPDDGVLMTFVIDSAGGVYSHIAKCPDYLFTVQQCWQCLSDIQSSTSTVSCMGWCTGLAPTRQCSAYSTPPKFTGTTCSTTVSCNGMSGCSIYSSSRLSLTECNITGQGTLPRATKACGRRPSPLHRTRYCCCGQTFPRSASSGPCQRDDGWLTCSTVKVMFAGRKCSPIASRKTRTCDT